MTRLKPHALLLLAFAFATPVAAQVAVRNGDADPQWPKVATDEPQWPNIAPENLPDPVPNPQPAFINPEQVTNRILGDHFGPSAGSKPPASPSADVTGSTARWPQFPQEREPSRFAFEVGARYWYSSGSMYFAFTNQHPFFGNPTSTLDWHGMTGHSGEVFARADHQPTGFFAKGVVAHGGITGGQIEDLDFFFDQIKFSDTTSDVKDGWLTSAMVDIGWAYSPVTDIRLGFFVGYHYWREAVTAYGVRCNPVSDLIINPCPAGSVPISFDIAVGRYEPTWHVLRLGAEGKMTFAERWSVAAEIAAVPFAALTNKDSHLLRQDAADLGIAPNVISDSKYAFGVEAELFVNYAVTPSIEVGVGGRYWGLVPYNGNVRFGPTFDNSNPLTNFAQQRYGVLLQVKGKF